MHSFPHFLSLLHLIIHLHNKWKTQTSTKCVLYRSHWCHLTLSTVYQVYCVMFLYQLSASCGTPRFLSNGQRHYSGITVGYTVTYTCNTGYRMTAGSSSRTCQSYGLWSGSHPTCTRKSTLCLYISFTYLLLTYERIASIIYSVCTTTHSISKTKINASFS